MIEIKLNTLLNNMNVLRELADRPVKGRTAYQLGKIIKAADEELEMFNDTRAKLLDEFAKKDENGEYILDSNNSYTFDGDNMKEFMNALNQVLNLDISINAGKVKLDDLEDLDFTPAQMVQLEAFIEE